MTNLLLVKTLLTQKVGWRLYLILMNLGITRARLHLKRVFRWLRKQERLKRRHLKRLISEELIATRKLKKGSKGTKNPQKHKINT